jgi:ATP-dependent Clp protease ATP-binding subunit ClpC
LGEHGLKVELTQEAREWLAKTGYDPAFGARPLKRALQKYVESPMSISVLSGEFQSNAQVVADVDASGDKLTFRLKETFPVEQPVETAKA